MVSSKFRDMPVDFICQHTIDGVIIPLRLRFRDEDGELQEHTIKSYKDTSTGSFNSFECRIIVRDTMRQVEIFSGDGKRWTLRVNLQ